jgi:hypothetical protein
LIRFLSILVLAASLRGCVTYEFEHEFWLATNGSGSFVVTAPPWVWNAVKNVGEAKNVDGTVNEQSVSALFQNPAILNLRVRKVTRSGRPYITVAADFTDVNALVGTRAFPDLVVSLRPEGGRLRLFGVWRRPPSSGTAQGDENGLMAVRFHLPSEIFDHRNATSGVERGNILSWSQDLRGGIAGAPIDFGATLGTRSVLSATLALFGFAIITGLSLMAAVLYFFTRRGKKRRGKHRKPGPPGGASGDPNFLNYDPT